MKKKLWLVIIGVLAIAGIIIYSIKFPLNITFGQIFASQTQTVVKVAVKDGSTGKTLQTTDPVKINKLMQDLSTEGLHHNLNPLTKTGWSYSIDFYFEGQTGYYEYTLNSGLRSLNGYYGNLVTGSYVAQDYNAVFQILQNFYKGLSSS